MKIQLLNPSIFWYAGGNYRMLPPLSLPILAAVLNRAGHQAEVVDLEAQTIDHYGLKTIYRKSEDRWPDVVGITALTITARGAKLAIQALREAGFHRTIVVGGVHATLHPEEVMGWGADLVVTGECEGNIVELLEADAKGIHAGKPLPIDEIPAPDWHHHSPSLTSYKGNTALVRPFPGISMWTRGCPYQCIFCSNTIFNHRPTRYRKPEAIAEEMAELKRRGCENVYVYDDELVGTKLPWGWMREIADRIEPLGLRWITQGRCSERFITPDLMAQMKRAGCHTIFWGIESYSPRVLGAINKHLTTVDIWSTLRTAKEAGIKNAIFTMVGNYQETEDDLALTTSFLRKAYDEGLIDYRQTTVCTGMPGTPLEKVMKDEGWWVDPPDYGPQMGQIYTGTPWLSEGKIALWLQRFDKVCPVGVPA